MTAALMSPAVYILHGVVARRAARAFYNQFLEGEATEHVHTPVHRCNDDVAIDCQRSAIRGAEITANIVAAATVQEYEHRSHRVVIVRPDIQEQAIFLACGAIVGGLKAIRLERRRIVSAGESGRCSRRGESKVADRGRRIAQATKDPQTAFNGAFIYTLSGTHFIRGKGWRFYRVFLGIATTTATTAGADTDNNNRRKQSAYETQETPFNMHCHRIPLQDRCSSNRSSNTTGRGEKILRAM
jgi:hypothetical protein